MLRHSVYLILAILLISSCQDTKINLTEEQIEVPPFIWTTFSQG